MSSLLDYHTPHLYRPGVCETFTAGVRVMYGEAAGSLPATGLLLAMSRGA